jgi:serine/threonine protein kinase
VSLRRRVQWLHQIVQTVQYLHDRRVMHRDIKSDNILLRADLTAVLADLEFSRRLGSELSGASSALGTPMFMAPEMAPEMASQQSCYYTCAATCTALA